MTCNGSLEELSGRLTATLHGSDERQESIVGARFHGVCTDTRRLVSGNVFVALSGERFDGHDYVAQALERGAIAAVVERPVAAAGFQLVVPNTLQAYQDIAHWWRSQFDIPVLAITGSAGKTSTKEMLAAALGCYGKVLKTDKNFNNDIGLPLTLLQLGPDHQFVVLELAMRGPGEIARLAAVAAPTHGIIVNIGTAHIGRLGSKAAIASAKCELLDHLDPETGIAILNGEDQLLLDTAHAVWSGTTRRFGFSAPGLTGNWLPSPPRIEWDDLQLPVPLPGRHQGLNYAAVLSAVDSLGLDIARLQSGVQLPAEASGRNQRYSLPDGVEVLDESYNAAPEAVIAALNLLCEGGMSDSGAPASSRRRLCWAVLGPMRELGAAADSLYADIGKVAASLAASGLQVCLFDPDAEMLALAGQVASDRLQCFQDREQLADWLCSSVARGDRLLFKAARSIAIETVMHRFLQSRYPNWTIPTQN